MPQWNRAIRLPQRRTSLLTIPQLAEHVARVIEQSGWLEETPYPDTLRDHLNQLKQATTRDEYVRAFEWIYEVADEDRVWIETF